MVKVKVKWFVAFLYVCINKEDYLDRLLIQVCTTACLYQQQKIEKKQMFYYRNILFECIRRLCMIMAQVNGISSHIKIILAKFVHHTCLIQSYSIT